MRRIGLTGGIASGKTMITDYLRSLGAVVIDADEISRNLTGPGSQVTREIAAVFGEDCLDENGCLRRSWLGRIIFEDERSRDKLNDIMHPRIEAIVLDEFAKREAAGESAVIYSAPLLLERGGSVPVDEVWVVALDEQEQIRRLRERNGLTREEALSRLRAQSGLDDKLGKADHIIDNNNAPQWALSQAKALWERVLSEATRDR